MIGLQLRTCFVPWQKGVDIQGKEYSCGLAKIGFESLHQEEVEYVPAVTVFGAVYALIRQAIRKTNNWHSLTKLNSATAGRHLL